MVSLLALGPAIAQSMGEKTGVNSALGIAPTTQDFVAEAASGDMFEIQSSQLAQQKSNNPQVKQFAQWATKTLPDLQHHLDMAQDLNKSTAPTFVNK
jgi:predicted outer membrane protein